MIYGYILMTITGLAAAISLAELSSAIPEAGGQYVWVAALAPEWNHRFLAYLTALMSWAGATCTCASACLAGVQLIFDVVLLLKPEFQYKRWMVFLAYQGVNLIILIPSCFERGLPPTLKATLAFTGMVLLTLFVGLFAASDHRVSAKDLFTGHMNSSGWPSGVAFIIGLNSPNWSYSCLDAIVHIADEIPNPRENIPKALMWTIAIGFPTGILTIFALFANAYDLSKMNSTLTILYYVFESKAAAVALQLAIVTSTLAGLWGVNIWQSRLAWKIGVNKGLPFSGHLRRVVGSPFHTPLWALLFSGSFVALLGFIYLASTTAFSSLIGAGLLFQYGSYMLPVICLLRHGRRNFAHGPFWHPVLGHISNVIVLAWTTVAIVFYCLPFSLPVAASDFNYISVVIGILAVVTMGFWFTFARKTFNVERLQINAQ